jgi:hypothetical protein
MVSQDAFIRHIDSLHLFGAGLDECAIHIDLGLGEKLGGLPGPNLQPSLVENILQCAHVMRRETSAKITCRGWVWHTFRTKAVQEGLVLAPQFHVLNAVAIAKCIVRETQNMIRFMIGYMNLQKVLAFIDSPRKAQLPDQLVHHGYSTIRGACMPRYHLHLHVRALQH